jgi:SnoaL-like domain
MVSELWELVARERIRDTLATYTWSGDAFRLDGLASTFFEHGVLELAGRDPIVGRAAIVEFLGRRVTRSEGTDDEKRREAAKAAASEQGIRRIVRHNVTNIRFVELTPELARVESYFTVFTEVGLDHMGRYRDVFEPADDLWLISHRFVSTDWRSERSTMGHLRSLPEERTLG